MLYYNDLDSKSHASNYHFSKMATLIGSTYHCSLHDYLYFCFSS